MRVYDYLLILFLVVGFAGLAACSTDDGAGSTAEASEDSAQRNEDWSTPDLTTSTQQDVAVSSPDSGGNWSDPNGGFDASYADTGWASEDTSSGPMPDMSEGEEQTGNTNVALSGGADIGYFRRLLDSNTVPEPEDITAEGFFAEHHTPLPEPSCGERICLQAMFGVMNNLIDGSNCTMLQIGLNSPILPNPANRPPLTLSVVVDVSGSMDAEDKIGFVRDGLERLVLSMQDDDQLAIISYSDSALVEYEMGAVVDHRDDMFEVVRSLRAEGGTNLYQGLETGYRQVLQHYDSGRQNRVILISDGQPTVGTTDTASIMRMSESFNSEGVGLTTIGLGVDFNVELMQGLARGGDGNYYFVENAGAVAEVFSDELSYFTVPVGYDLMLDVETGRDFDLVAARGSSFWEDTEEGGHIEVPSMFLAHRVSHDDVTDSGGRRGGGSALLLELMPDIEGAANASEPSHLVATIDVSFREPGSDEIVEDTVLVNYPLNPWEVEERGYWDASDVSIIHKSFVMLNIFVGLQGACQMFHMGAGREAVGSLERLLAAVEDYNEELGDVDMQYDIELIEQLLEVLRSNGADEPEELDMPEDPWPCD